MDITRKIFIYRTDMEDFTFRVRLISSRQSFEDSDKEYYRKCVGRTDMFWIEVFHCDKDLCYVAVDNLAGLPVCDPRRFSLTVQHAEVESEGDCFIEAVRTWFMAQPEYQQQIDWVSKLDPFIKTARG